MITEFRGNYYFLSNFYPWPFKYGEYFYQTSEHAFQCAKTSNRRDFAMVMTATSPAMAKRLGSKVALIKGWDQERDNIMYEVLKAKFFDPRMRERLLSTGDQRLIEGNTWNDKYWGCVWNGNSWIGQNKLGQILMRVRSELS